jgi:isocitrate dehydrogenase
MLSKKYKKHLQQSFTKRQIHKTTFDLPKHKAMSIDGIAMEIFQETWLDIKDHVSKTYSRKPSRKGLNIGNLK